MIPASSPQPDNTSSLQSTHRLTTRLVAVLVFFFALFVFTYHTNVEFQGNDDYLHSCEATFCSRMQLFPASFSRPDLARFARTTIRPFIHAPHNLMPALAFGFLYRILDALGVPFSVALIHFPVALMSAICCAVFFLLLRKLGFDLLTAILGTLILIIAPIFSMNSRGIATRFLAVLPFSQVLALYALQNLSDRKSTRVWAALALLNAALSDVLFFLTVPAFLVAYGLRKTSVGEFLRSPRASLAAAWENAKPLRNKLILLPLACVLVWWVALTIAAIVAAHFGVWHPETPLYRLGSHTAHTGSMLFQHPAALHNYASVLAGEAFLYIFLAALAVYCFFVKDRITGFAWSFAVVAGLGYGTLWYVLCRDDWGVRHYYQIYVLVPLLLILLHVFRAIAQQYPKSKYILRVGLCIILLFAGLGNLSYIWNIPLAIHCPAYNEWTHGANYPNTGTKAVGYLVRRICETACNQQQLQSIRFYPKPRSTSLEVFSGLMFDGRWYEERCGVKPRVTIEEMDDPAKVLPLAGEEIPALCVLLDLRPSTSSASLSSKDYVRYNVLSDGVLMASLFVLPPNSGRPDDLKPGDYTLDSLDQRFDATYRRFVDYFPYP